MDLGQIIWAIFQIIIGYNLVLPFILFLIWILLSPKKLNNLKLIQADSPADYAIIITAYEQTDNLESVVASVKNLNYHNYIIYIVADNCDITNLSFDDDKTILLKPSETLASNTESHQYAINNFIRKHERVTIIDSDNLLDKDYLNWLNIYFSMGYLAVQGTRAAKNLDTTFACLDAARDIYYHFYDGKILYQLGSSATLSGSGMAFETELYKYFLSKNKIKGAGFDKILQAHIVKQDLKIAFAKEAIVFDEKTSQPEQLVKQRARWINTWFKYFSLGFTILSSGIKNLSLNQFLFGAILLRPPLFIFIILSLLCLLMNLVTLNLLAVFIWIISLALFTVGFVVSLVYSNTDRRIYSSLKNIPQFIYFQILSLLKSRKANKHSVSTRHFHNNGIEQLNR